MAVGKHKDSQEQTLFITTSDLRKAPSHPFYRKLKEILAEVDFDRRVESLTAQFYAPKMGRPSLPPGVYVRMLLVGFFEGIDSERGIAWRCADSLALQEFLGYGPTDGTPNHSTLSGTRRRLPLEWHQEVFAMVSAILVEKELFKGNTVAIDATTVEANAAMRSIVRRDSKLSYQEFIKTLAEASGIETPTAAQLQQFDRTRKGKRVSNQDWESRTDPDAKVTRMKDGRTRMGYKAENAVDLETGAIVNAEIHPGDEGDTKTGPETLDGAQMMMSRVKEHAPGFETTRAEAVTDKGYHKGALISDLEAAGYRTYFSERDVGRRRWTGPNGVKSPEKAREQAAVYANRRRVRGKRGRRLMRKRAELSERTNAHLLDTGGMRRTWLRGRENVAKRYHIQAAAFNLSLVLRMIFGVGKPRGLAGLFLRLYALIIALWNGYRRVFGRLIRSLDLGMEIAH